MNLAALTSFLPASWLPVLIQLIALALIGGFFYRVHRRQQAQQAALEADLHAWLMRQFGLPFEEDAFGPHPPAAPGLGALKSHRVLRLQSQLAPPGDHAERSMRLSAQIILRDHQNQYWLALYEGRCSALAQPRGQGSALRITELRARRALFNDPAAYQKAFGQAPTLAGLNAWRKQHPAQDEQETRRHENFDR